MSAYLELLVKSRKAEAYVTCGYPPVSKYVLRYHFQSCRNVLLTVLSKMMGNRARQLSQGFLRVGRQRSVPHVCVYI